MHDALEVRGVVRIARSLVLGALGIGNFTLIHGLASDSKGNLYIAETVDGRRLQKFMPRGRISPQGLDTYVGSPHYEPFPGRER